MRSKFWAVATGVRRDGEALHGSVIVADLRLLVLGYLAQVRRVKGA